MTFGIGWDALHGLRFHMEKLHKSALLCFALSVHAFSVQATACPAPGGAKARGAGASALSTFSVVGPAWRFSSVFVRFCVVFVSFFSQIFFNESPFQILESQIFPPTISTNLGKMSSTTDL